MSGIGYDYNDDAKKLRTTDQGAQLSVPGGLRKGTLTTLDLAGGETSVELDAATVAVDVTIQTAESVKMGFAAGAYAYPALASVDAPYSLPIVPGDITELHFASAGAGFVAGDTVTIQQWKGVPDA